MRLDVVSADDWEGWWLDDRMVFEHHSMPTPDILLLFARNSITEIHYYEYIGYGDECLLDKQGQFPIAFSDIPTNEIKEWNMPI